MKPTNELERWIARAEVELSFYAEEGETESDAWEKARQKLVRCVDEIRSMTLTLEQQ